MHRSLAEPRRISASAFRLARFVVALLFVGILLLVIRLIRRGS